MSLQQSEGCSARAREVVVTGRCQVNPFTPGSEAAPGQASRVLVSQDPDPGILEVLRNGERHVVPPLSSSWSSHTAPVRPLGAGAGAKPAAAARAGPWGRAPQEGRQSVSYPDSPRVLSVSVGRLVAKLPVIVSAVALDVDAADAVPKLEDLLVFIGGSLAAAAACGLQQGVVRDTGALIK